MSGAHAQALHYSLVPQPDKDHIRCRQARLRALPIPNQPEVAIMSNRIDIGPARRSDRDELRAMQALSFRVLGAPFYDEPVIETFIADIGTMDDNLLDDGTYFKATEDGRIVGCGGWSWRTPGYVARMAADPPPGRATGATVRSVYVHPDCARRGIARALMSAIEAEMVAAGFGAASLTATLSGIPLYRRLGYASGGPVALRLAGERLFVGLAMSKPLARAGSPEALAA